jgi:hypothetical protein
LVDTGELFRADSPGSELFEKEQVGRRESEPQLSLGSLDHHWGATVGMIRDAFILPHQPNHLLARFDRACCHWSKSFASSSSK